MTTTTLKLYSTTIGKKAIMSVTGLMLFGFVLIHLLGNLQLFSGPEQMNGYAAFLKKSSSVLWSFRLILLTALGLHVLTAVQLTLLSWRGRPIAYYQNESIEAGWASRTMRWTGPIILLYIVYHLLHLTVGSVHPRFDLHDVYANTVIGFGSMAVAAAYALAMVALGVHLRHGIWSAFQTLGLIIPRVEAPLRTAALVAAVILALGFITLPISVLLGWIR